MNIIINKEEKSQAISLLYKGILGFVPGGHILDEMLEYRANVQRDRLSKFSEFLKNGFEDCTGKSFEPENLKSENFIDAFEVIIRKVASTSSEEKLKRYRNVLLRIMFEKNESEIFFKYVNLIEEVSETQVLILSGLHTNERFNEDTIKLFLINPEMYNDETNTTLPESDNIQRGFKMFNGQVILDSELDLFIHDLKSRGIINIIKNPVSKAYVNSDYVKEWYEIMPIGKGFIEFITEYGKG